MTSYADLLVDGTRKLAASSSPRLDAEVLLRHVAGLDRAGLLVALRDPAPDEVRDRFDALVARRAAGTPVAYLTGTREFMGLAFSIDDQVLVPRPETELLVEWALALLERFKERPVRVVDVGAGSGAIAVSLAALASDPVDVIAVEPSAGARAVIERNRDALLSWERRSRFRIVDNDLLTGMTGPFALVLANLPYLTPGQIAENPDLAAEPRMALDGGDDGLDLVRRLVAQLPDRLADS
ncbi:MAG TPA: HemK/PrmC family methyltransferase, partial [Thermomicrobiales bacterium]|nr:HemK/PrmC family methyltransferase [Thermomicrobiales bacterium]